MPALSGESSAQSVSMVRNVVTPTLTAYFPDPTAATDTAVIICPAGGLRFLGWFEGTNTAQWFAAHGVGAFVLKYRVVPTAADPVEFEQESADFFREFSRVIERGKRPRTFEEIRRPVRSGLPVDRPGVIDVRRRRSADDHRELWQHPDPALLGQPTRRHLALCLSSANARSCARKYSRGSSHGGFFPRGGHDSVSEGVSYRHVTEQAALASELEQLPALADRSQLRIAPVSDDSRCLLRPRIQPSFILT